MGDSGLDTVLLHGRVKGVEEGRGKVKGEVRGGLREGRGKKRRRNMKKKGGREAYEKEG